MPTTQDPLDVALDQNWARQLLPPPAVRKLIRNKAGVTKTAVARTLGVHHVTVARWEREHDTPGLEVAPRYLDLLRRMAAEAGLSELVPTAPEARRGRAR